MDEFIKFLGEVECDEKTITDFKEKINKPIEYKLHLDKYEFTEKWFSTLDDILVELGYRALDADISYIKEVLRDKIDISSYIKNMINTYGVCSLLSIDIEELVEHLVKITIPSHTNYLRVLDWYEFSGNTTDVAVKYLIQYQDNINPYRFSRNKNINAVRYLIEHPDKISWSDFSQNEVDIAVKFLIEHYPDKISWHWFSKNKSSIAVKYSLEHLDKINWKYFSRNESDLAVRYLLEHPDKIDLYRFASNMADLAVDYILEHPDEINWGFSFNENSIAVKYLIEHPDKIDWLRFSYNESDLAVSYLLEHLDKIDLDNFRFNKNIHAVRYCSEKDKSMYHYLLQKEELQNAKINEINKFNKLNLLPRSRMKL